MGWRAEHGAFAEEDAAAAEAQEAAEAAKARGATSACGPGMSGLVLDAGAASGLGTPRGGPAEGRDRRQGGVAHQPAAATCGSSASGAKNEGVAVDCWW